MKSNFKLEIEKILNLFNSGNYNRVLELSKFLIKKDENLDFVLNIIGLCYQKQNNFEQAENFFLRTISVNKSNINAHTNLANNFKYKLDFKKAHEIYNKVLKEKPDHIPALLNLANLKFSINQNKTALDLLLKAVKIRQDIIPIHLNLAIIYQSIGNFDLALNHLKKINELDPTFTRSDKMISHLTDYHNESQHLNDMKKKLETLKLDHNQKIYLYFGIAKGLEDQKDYKNALKYIYLGNNLKYKNTKYNFEDDKIKTRNIQKIFKNYNFKLKSNKNDEIKPIFILGMPRSGTSLVEQIISSHSKVKGLGELNFFNNFANNEFFSKNVFKSMSIGQANLDDIKKNYNNIISNFDINNLKFTDKTLLNFNWIGLIKLCYPNAKLINCYRNSKDNCISIYKNLFDHEGAWCYDEDNLVKYYKLYREMIDFWKKMIPGFIYDVKYEDLVNNPEVSIKKIIKYCNLDWEENCINFYKNKNAIKTLSVKQVRNSIYSSSINSFNKFEKFSKDLFKNL